MIQTGVSCDANLTFDVAISIFSQFYFLTVVRLPGKESVGMAESKCGSAGINQ